MNLGTQYYRPQFPNARYWEQDLSRMRDSGLNTVQLWVVWGWVEPKPGEFRFDDYDRLVELAGEKGLGVILSTIAEVQPYWILREEPGCDLVNHLGQRVPSVNRNECHFGCTPGGCTDHPGVWERMRRFLETVVGRYRGAANLRGWDAWNELRWNVLAEGRVCYCDHTLRRYREWLDAKYGGLEGLNRAWQRRYGTWDEVWPGRFIGTPYTDTMAFAHFLTNRANRHAKARYDAMKAIDPSRPVTVHGPAPSIEIGGSAGNHALNRGNDWFYADYTDGVGCSSFPKWMGIDDAGFGLRVEAVRSAAQGKHVWLSEVQGGRSATGFEIHDEVPAAAQQRWIWNGIASGADTILLWCWRDEVFGYESGGFGIAGDDGLAEARTAALAETGRALEAHADLVDAYRPGEAEAGILFSPQAYYLTWAQEGTAARAVRALTGYARALTRRSIPFRFVEEAHLEALEGLNILFLPRALVTDKKTEQALEAWVRTGGMLVAESECGAFDSAGVYRYPVDRFTSRLAGTAEVGRRKLDGDTVQVEMDGRPFVLPAAQWMTPWRKGAGRPLAETPEGALLLEAGVGRGRLVVCGTYLGEAYLDRWTADFEAFIEALVRRAGCTPDVEVLAPEPDEKAFLYVKTGASDGKTMAFVFFPEGWDEARVRFAPGLFASGEATDLVSGARVKLAASGAGREATLVAPPRGFAVLVED